MAPLGERRAEGAERGVADEAAPLREEVEQEDALQAGSPRRGRGGQGRPQHDWAELGVAVEREVVPRHPHAGGGRVAAIARGDPRHPGALPRVQPGPLRLREDGPEVALVGAEDAERGDARRVLEIVHGEAELRARSWARVRTAA